MCGSLVQAKLLTTSLPPAIARSTLFFAIVQYPSLPEFGQVFVIIIKAHVRSSLYD